jgi:hypothetical protein
VGRRRLGLGCHTEDSRREVENFIPSEARDLARVGL